MTLEQEILQVLNQIVPTIEKAFFEVIKSYPGHPGRPGHVGGSAPKGGGGDLSQQIAEHAKKEKERQIELETTVRHGRQVEFYGHTSSMAASLNKPKEKIIGRVTHLDKDEQGNQIARVEFSDKKGKSRSTWLNTKTDTWRHTSQKQWNKANG